MNLVVTFLFSAITCWLISFPVIWILKVFKIGQNIRQEGPSIHQIKAGTPTMGGIPILLTVIIFIVILINIDIDIKYFALVLLFLSYAALGFLDDAIKLKKRRNEGLTRDQKTFLQLIFAVIFAGILVWTGHNNTVDHVLKSIYFDSPWAYFPFVCLIVIGGANAVNLTDGLDGLAGSTLAIAFAAFAVICFNIQSNDPGIIAASAAGACVAFLWFNHYPAEVFMGDVGSMGLGALLSGIAILMHMELVFVVIGGVFVIETLSVMIQVTFFRLFKRRIFKMTPLHHHFELLGMPEPLVVLMFMAAAIVFAVAGVWISTLI
jgi:phospho-N-acetylmuramoyl-pentapeptide-transferase